MAFINKDDLLKDITADMLNAVLDSDDTLIDQAADEAEAKMREYLNGKFDIETIFTATGTDRHNLVLSYCKAITIYNLWAHTDPLGIPSLRKTAYDEAMQWLKDVMGGKIATTLPAATAANESGGDVYFGSNDARENHY